MKAKDHLTKLNEYKNRAAAIESDTRYTDAGKQPQREALRAEMNNQIDRLVIDLQAEYDEARKAYDNVEAAKASARADYEAGWDFSRLQYTQDQIRSQVNAARDLSDVEQAYKNAQGDNYKIRVWGEIGADLVSNKGYAEMAGGLIGEMKRAASSLSNTPAMLKAQQSEAEIAQRAYDLRADTLTITETLNTMGFGYKSYQTQELASQIRVKVNGGLGNGYLMEFAGID